MYITLVSINGKVDYPYIIHLFLSMGSLLSMYLCILHG